MDAAVHTTLGTLGCRGLTGVVNGGVATLYATTTASDIVTVTDTGAASVVSSVVTSASNTVFRGLRLITTPGSVTFAGTGSPTTVGVPTIGTSNGLPVLGNTAFTMTAGNLLPSGIGFTLLNPTLVEPLPFGSSVGMQVRIGN